MSIHAPRLSRIFTPTYAARINAQITHHLGKPESKVIDPDGLASVMFSPLQASLQAQLLERSAPALGAQISYWMITKAPFQDCNNSTGFFIANQYIKATGHSGFFEQGKISDVYKDIVDQARQFSK